MKGPRYILVLLIGSACILASYPLLVCALTDPQFCRGEGLTDTTRQLLSWSIGLELSGMLLLSLLSDFRDGIRRAFSEMRYAIDELFE